MSVRISFKILQPKVSERHIRVTSKILESLPSRKHNIFVAMAVISRGGLLTDDEGQATSATLMNLPDLKASTREAAQSCQSRTGRHFPMCIFVVNE